MSAETSSSPEQCQQRGEARSPFKHYRLTVEEFAERFGLVVEFLPFAHLEDEDADEDEDEINGRLDEMQEIGTFLNSRPPTCQYTSLSTISGPKVLDGYSRCAKELFDIELTCLLFGWWPAKKTPYAGLQFGNPDYAHPDVLEHVTGREERRKLFERAASIGLHQKQLAPMIGYAEHKDPRGSVAGLLGKSYDDLDYQSRKREGQIRLARTWKTAYEWGYSYPEIAAAFGKNPGPVRGRVSEYARDFIAPPDPSYDYGRRVAMGLEDHPALDQPGVGVSR